MLFRSFFYLGLLLISASAFAEGKGGISWAGGGGQVGNGYTGQATHVVQGVSARLEKYIDQSLKQNKGQFEPNEIAWLKQIRATLPSERRHGLKVITAPMERQAGKFVAVPDQEFFASWTENQIGSVIWLNGDYLDAVFVDSDLKVLRPQVAGVILHGLARRVRWDADEAKVDQLADHFWSILNVDSGLHY